MVRQNKQVSSSRSLYVFARKNITKRKQFILYALIGMSGVAIDYVAYALGVKVLGMGVLLANLISVSLGILNNFVLNTKYNFKTHDRILARFGLFYSIGFLGLLLSDVLLVLFTDGLGIGPLVAKLLTLPLVLVGQYLFNKKLAFGSIEESISFMKRLLKHWPAYVIVLVFILSSLAFVKFIPSNFTQSPPGKADTYAPDEGRHYIYNVKFIMENHRLPISGKDDLSAYKDCHSNDLIRVPCIYSYTFYPASSYIINAVSAGVLSKTFDMTKPVAARLPSTLYGAIFVLCIYFSSYLIARRRIIATAITIGIGLLPQFIFTSSYTNLDAHSIAISGLLGLTFVLFILAPAEPKRQIWLAIVACGLLPLAKYNFFFLFMPVAFTAIYFYRSKYINRSAMVRLAAYGFASFVLLSSFWYVRNLVLYHDLLGQNFAINEMAKYHALGQPLSLTLSSLVIITSKGFFNLLFSSFYLAFGQMALFLENYRYAVPGTLNLIGIAYLTYIVSTSKKLRPLIWASVVYVALFIFCLFQVLYNSMNYDFQPQGRYMFPMLVPTALYLAYAYKLDKRLGALSLLLAVGTLYIYIHGMEYFVRLYVNI